MELKDTVLGIEFGSTRIKAVLLDRDHRPIASGAHDWENRLIDGIWTYTMDDIHLGLQDCYAKLKEDVKEMKEGYECGMSLEGHNDIKEGDVVECYIMEEIPR